MTTSPAAERAPTRSRRPLTDAEAALLRSRIGSPLQLIAVMIAGAGSVLLGAVLGFLPAELYALEGFLYQRLLPGLGIGLGAIFPGWLYGVVRRRLARDRATIGQDLAAGEAEVLDVTVERAWSLPVEPTLGPVFVVECGPTRIFLGTPDRRLFGLEPLPETAASDDLPFPTRTFRLHRAPRSGIVLKVERGAERVPAASGTPPGFSLPRTWPESAVLPDPSSD